MKSPFHPPVAFYARYKRLEAYCRSLGFPLPTPAPRKSAFKALYHFTARLRKAYTRKHLSPD